MQLWNQNLAFERNQSNNKKEDEEEEEEEEETVSQRSFGNALLCIHGPCAASCRMGKTHEEIAEILSILKACAKQKNLRAGIEVHSHIQQRGLLPRSTHLGSSLVCMYANCGDLPNARKVLHDLPLKTAAAWNALLSGCVRCGEAHAAIDCFQEMRKAGVAPDAVTFTCVLNACAMAGSLPHGEVIHGEVLNAGLWGKDVMLGNALVGMYAKCGDLPRAIRAFDELPTRNVVSWNVVMAGHVQQGHGLQALRWFDRMETGGVSLDPYTFSCALTACANAGELCKGEEIHDKVISNGFLESNAVLGTALVDLYAKCGQLTSARKVLSRIRTRDVISWNALIAGYADHGQAEEAMECFDEMKHEGLRPNAVTFSCILKASGSCGAISAGEAIHDEILRSQALESNVVLGTALVDMYAKCGALRRARRVLGSLCARDVVAWSSLIAGFAQQGEGEKALRCFEAMEMECISPNTVTFRSLLQACSHSGLVDEGEMLFTAMATSYGVVPDLEHHACMVDLFGRAGHFDKAVAMITEIPCMSDYPPLWGALLGMCQKWGNVSLGKLAFEQAIQLDAANDAAYACMSNIYTVAGMLDDAERINAMRLRNIVQ